MSPISTAALLLPARTHTGTHRGFMGTGKEVLGGESEHIPHRLGIRAAGVRKRAIEPLCAPRRDEGRPELPQLVRARGPFPRCSRAQPALRRPPANPKYPHQPPQQAADAAVPRDHGCDGHPSKRHTREGKHRGHVREVREPQSRRGTARSGVGRCGRGGGARGGGRRGGGGGSGCADLAGRGRGGGRGLVRVFPASRAESEKKTNFIDRMDGERDLGFDVGGAG